MSLFLTALAALSLQAGPEQQAAAALDRMHAAHCAWDGIDRPVRSIADLG